MHKRFCGSPMANIRRTLTWTTRAPGFSTVICTHGCVAWPSSLLMSVPLAYAREHRSKRAKDGPRCLGSTQAHTHCHQRISSARVRSNTFSDYRVQAQQLQIPTVLGILTGLKHPHLTKSSPLLEIPHTVRVFSSTHPTPSLFGSPASLTCQHSRVSSSSSEVGSGQMTEVLCKPGFPSKTAYTLQLCVCGWCKRKNHGSQRTPSSKQMSIMFRHMAFPVWYWFPGEIDSCLPKSALFIGISQECPY